MITNKLPSTTIAINNQTSPVDPAWAAKYIGMGGMSINSNAVK